MFNQRNFFQVIEQNGHARLSSELRSHVDHIIEDYRSHGLPDKLIWLTIVGLISDKISDQETETLPSRL